MRDPRSKHEHEMVVSAQIEYVHYTADDIIATFDLTPKIALLFKSGCFNSRM